MVKYCLYENFSQSTVMQNPKPWGNVNALREELKLVLFYPEFVPGHLQASWHKKTKNFWFNQVLRKQFGVLFDALGAKQYFRPAMWRKPLRSTKATNNNNLFLVTAWILEGYTQLHFENIEKSSTSEWTVLLEGWNIFGINFYRHHLSSDFHSSRHICTNSIWCQFAAIRLVTACLTFIFPELAQSSLK